MRSARNLVLAAALAAAGAAAPIEIAGDARFTRQVQAALALLRRRAPASYGTVARYIGRIEQGPRSGMWAYKNPPTYALADATALRSITWCAASIVHDACHSRLYHEHKRAHGRVPAAVWTGLAAEKTCLADQLAAMQTFGAPALEIDWVRRQDGRHFDANGNGKSDWSDYRSRSH